MLLNNSKLIVLPHSIDDDPSMQTKGSAEAVISEIKKLSSEVLPLELLLETRRFELSNAKIENPKAKYINEIIEHIPIIADRTKAACDEAFKSDARVLSVGGNHTRALELLGYLRSCEKHGKEPVIIWIDAHFDCHTPDTSESGNVHGMVAALLFGKGYPELLKLFEGVKLPEPKNIIFVGYNAEDAAEMNFLKETGCNIYEKSELGVSSDKNWASLNNYLVAIIKDTPNAAIWIEVDLDVCKTDDCPGVVMENTNGLEFQKVHEEVTFIASYMPLIGMGITEICLNNDLDNKTVKNAANLAYTLAGVRNPDYALSNHQRPSESFVKETPNPDSNYVTASKTASKSGEAIKWLKATAAGAILTLSGLLAYKSNKIEEPENNISISTKTNSDNNSEALIEELKLTVSSLKHEVHVLKNPKSWDSQYGYTGIFSGSAFNPVFAVSGSKLTDENVIKNYASLWANNGKSSHSMDSLVSICFVNELVTGKKPDILLEAMLSDQEIKDVTKEYEKQYFKLKHEEHVVRDYLGKFSWTKV